MVLYPNKLPESERVCSGICTHDRQGNRIETVEFSLSQGKVIQSRGVCNSNTEYHDRIVKLVNDNAHRFLEARASA